MTDQLRSDIIEKVRKVLALGQSPNQNEAEVALRKAANLIREHNLTEEELHQAEPSAIVSLMVMVEGARDLWLSHLAVAIAEASFCKVLFGHTYVVIIGRQREADLVKSQFVQFHALALSMAQTAPRGMTWDQMAYYHGGGKKKAKRDWLKSFLLGFTSSVKKALAADLKEFKEESQTSTALVVVREAEVVQYMEEKYSDITPFKSRRHQINGMAFQQGVEKGKEAFGHLTTLKLD